MFRRLRGILMMLDVLVLPCLVVLTAFAFLNAKDRIDYHLSVLNRGYENASKQVQQDIRAIRLAGQSIENKFEIAKLELEKASREIDRVTTQLERSMRLPPLQLPALPSVNLRPIFDPVFRPISQAFDEIEIALVSPFEPLEGIDVDFRAITSISGTFTDFYESVDEANYHVSEIFGAIALFLGAVLLYLGIFMVTRIPGWILGKLGQFADGWNMMLGRPV